MVSELLIFHVDEGRFGIPSSQVREVLRAVTISPVADAPAVVMGVINLRGQVLVVLDSRRLLRLVGRQIRHTDHLIVVEIDGHLLAVCVDRAIDLVRVEDVDLELQGWDAIGTTGHRFAKTEAGLVQLVDLNCCIAEVESVQQTNALPCGVEANT